MKNLPFVLWMIGFPTVTTFNLYVNEYLLGNTYSVAIKGIISLVVLAIWFFVGYLLYEPKDSK